MTASLHWILVQVQKLRKEGVLARAKAFTKKVLRKINYELLRRPVLRQRLIRWSRKLRLHALLKSLNALAHGRKQIFYVGLNSPYAQLDSKKLPPRTRQIYADLKRTAARHQK